MDPRADQEEPLTDEEESLMDQEEWDEQDWDEQGWDQEPPADLEEANFDRVKDLVSQGASLPPSTLLGAITWGLSDTLHLLLSAGVDPNRLLDDDTTSGVEAGWMATDPAPYFYWERDLHRPLYGAAWPRGSDSETLNVHSDMMGALLGHGADLYAVFRQPLLRPQINARSAYPGEDPRPELDVRLFEDNLDLERLNEIYEGKDTDDCDDMAPPKYGLRDVVHAIFEDGLVVKPILDSPEFSESVKLEHRDPQGRTLFLSACRSALGADAALGSNLLDIVIGPNSIADIQKPFPPGIYADAHGPPLTALQSLMALGADPLATDNQGKNALHHLLEACDWNHNTRPPIIRQSLRYLATRFPLLVTQNDRNGTQPLHAALQRLRRHVAPTAYVEAASPLEDCVTDLMAAGADVHARDGRGNTALHYLADADLDDVKHGQARRKLFYTLLDEHDCAADINARNAAGRTAAQLLLDNGGAREEKRILDFGPRSDVEPGEADAVDSEILSKLDTAGVAWGERDALGRTLLHAVAAHNTDRAEGRCRFLLGKGIDPLARDAEGKTARDLALRHRSKAVAQLLEKHEAAMNTVSLRGGMLRGPRFGMSLFVSRRWRWFSR